MTVTNWATYFGGGITIREGALDPLEEIARNFLSSSRAEVITQAFCSTYDLVGLAGTSDGQCIFVASYYDSRSYLPGQSGGGMFVWKADALKSTHNGVTIISPTVPWDGAQSTLSAFYAKTGETSPSGTGCWVRQYEELCVEMAGAVGDRTTDDTGAFNQIATIVGNSGGGTFRFSGAHLLDNGLSLPDYVTCLGPLGLPDEIKPGLSADYDAKYGALIVNSTKTITLNDSASIGNCVIVCKGLDLPLADVTAAVAAVAAFAGTAITIGGQGAYIHHALILGFNRAIDSTDFERTRCEYVFGDCTNGIRIARAFDIAYIENCHFWPFTTTHRAFTVDSILVRNGTAYEFTNVGDWSKFTNCFSYGYANGFVVASCDHVQMIGCGTDYPGALASTSVGYTVSGTSREALMLGCQAAAQGTAVLVNSSASQAALRLVGSDFWDNDTYHVRVQTGRAVINGSNTFSGGSVGVQIDSGSGGALVEGNDFNSVTTPISASGTGLELSNIGKNNYRNCVDSSIGIRRNFDNQFATETQSAYSSSGSGKVINCRYARGSATTPTVSQNADIAFKLKGQVYTGTAFGDIAMIRAQASGAPAAGSTPGAIILSTTPSGSTGLVDYLQLDQTGDFFPLSNGAYKLGKTSFRWSGVNTVDVDATGGALIGAATGGNKGAGTINLAGLSNLFVSLNGGSGIYAGTGSPEGVVTATVSSIYFRTDGSAGTVRYRKETGAGNTGWVADNVHNSNVTVTTTDNTNAALAVTQSGTAAGFTVSGTSTLTTNSATASLGITQSGAGFGLKVSGSIGFGAPVTKTGDFTVGNAENFLINNKAGSACVVTLPSAATYSGRVITILNYQAQTVDSASANVVPITGGAAGTAIIAATAGKWAKLISDGTNWLIIEAN